jgi:hypothetical protein
VDLQAAAATQLAFVFLIGPGSHLLRQISDITHRTLADRATPRHPLQSPSAKSRQPGPVCLGGCASPPRGVFASGKVRWRGPHFHSETPTKLPVSCSSLSDFGSRRHPAARALQWALLHVTVCKKCRRDTAQLVCHTRTMSQAITGRTTAVTREQVLLQATKHQAPGPRQSPMRDVERCTKACTTEKRCAACRPSACEPVARNQMRGAWHTLHG